VDPSIKSLTQFPTVLNTMNDSLAWTSSLGEAYYNQPADVMNAIQVLRNMAMAAGTLKSTAQQNVEVQPAPPATQGGAQPSVQQTVIIQPAQPTTVYVPQYNPTTAYGAPVPAPTGYTGSDLLLTGVLSFGAGILLGSLINNGNNNWGCSWNGDTVTAARLSTTTTFTLPTTMCIRAGLRLPATQWGISASRLPPRPAPYPATRPAYNGGSANNRPNNPAIPATRPYDKKTARPANPDIAKPNFPRAARCLTIGRFESEQEEASKESTRTACNPVAGTRPTGPNAENRPANKAAIDADPARGFAKEMAAQVAAIAP